MADWRIGHYASGVAGVDGHIIVEPIYCGQIVEFICQEPYLILLHLCRLCFGHQDCCYLCP